MLATTIIDFNNPVKAEGNYNKNLTLRLKPQKQKEDKYVDSRTR